MRKMGLARSFQRPLNSTPRRTNPTRAGALVGGGGAGEVEPPLSDGLDWRWACGFFASPVTEQCQRFAATLFAWNEATTLSG